MDIKLQGELGNVLAEHPSHIQNVLILIDENLSQAELEKTFCLQFIDPYGDTTFNQIQTKVLADEFKSLLAKSNDEDAKQIQSVIDFVSKCGVHEYIKFIGD